MKVVARKAKPKFSEEELTKGQLRKLTALRKSLGDDIADKAFAEWLKNAGDESAAPKDKDADLIVEALEPLIEKKKLRIRRGGYIVTRGRGRVIVTPANI